MNKNAKNEAGSKTDDVPLVQGVRLFMQKQGVVVYIAGVGIMLAVFVLVFYAIRVKRDNEQASRLLGVAQTQKQFEDLYGQYPKSSAAPVALFAMAASQFGVGDYNAASAHYAEFIRKYPKHPMLSAAELGQTMCSEASGDTDKALLGFNSFLLTHPDSYLTPQALFGKARCLQVTGKWTEARIVYENFIAANPKSKWRQQAESALQSLDRQVRVKTQGS